MPDHVRMKRVGEFLSGEHKRFGRIFKVREHWKEIAGEVLAAHVEPVFIKEKVLHALCDSPAWVQQMGILSPALTAQIRKLTGIRLDRVEGKFGMPVKRPERKKPPRIFLKPAIDREDLGRITDPELARAVRCFMDAAGNNDDSE